MDATIETNDPNETTEQPEVTAEELRAKAEKVRQQAANASGDLERQALLAYAEELERRAETAEGGETTEGGESVEPEAPGIDYVTLDYAELAQQFVTAMDRLEEQRQPLHHLRVNPQAREGFIAAIQALSDDVMDPFLKQHLPELLEDDERVATLYLVTAAEMEAQFLFRHYGPEQTGGTGLIPRLQRYLQEHNYPVTITTDYLRARFLREVEERVPQIVRAYGGVQPGLDLSQLRGR